MNITKFQYWWDKIWTGLTINTGGIKYELLTTIKIVGIKYEQYLLSILGG